MRFRAQQRTLRIEQARNGRYSVTRPDGQPTHISFRITGGQYSVEMLRNYLRNSGVSCEVIDRCLESVKKRGYVDVSCPRQEGQSEADTLQV